MAEYKLNYTGEKVQSILELAEGQIPDIKNKAFYKVTPQQFENGLFKLVFSSITESETAVELPLNSIKLGETITTTVDVGNLKKGTIINSGESLQNILKMILCNSKPVTGVTLNKSTTSIVINKTETLTATVLPTDATNKNVTWTSSDNEIATVNSTGVVTAKSLGNATITVTTEDGGFTAVCAIAVEPVRVESVSLNKSSLNINIGSTAKLNAMIVPNNATNKNVTWTSSDTSVATISANKLEATISAIKEGNTMITVTTEDGSKTATCNVNAVAPAPTKFKLYYGATDNVPTSISELAYNAELPVETSQTYAQTIVCGHGSGRYSVGQYPIFAVPKEYTITKWVVTTAPTIPLEYTVVEADNYKLYYIPTLVTDHDLTPPGTNYTITIVKGA